MFRKNYVEYLKIILQLFVIICFYYQSVKFKSEFEKRHSIETLDRYAFYQTIQKYSDRPDTYTPKMLIKRQLDTSKQKTKVL